MVDGVLILAGDVGLMPVGKTVVVAVLLRGILGGNIVCLHKAVRQDRLDRIGIALAVHITDEYDRRTAILLLVCTHQLVSEPHLVDTRLVRIGQTPGVVLKAGLYVLPPKMRVGEDQYLAVRFRAEGGDM